MEHEDTELRETEGRGGIEGAAASCGICLKDLHFWDIFALQASKLELQEKDTALEQMEARGGIEQTSADV